VTSAIRSAPAPEEAAAAGASGSERLRALAALPLAGAGRRGPRLVARLREFERAIEAAYGRLRALPRQVVERSRAAEWLLDNHYVVQRAVRGLKEEFPVGFERKLRLVAHAGQLNGLPLVYLVARELVALGQGRVDIDSISNGIAEVQAVRSLSIAEVWALPALLRLGVLEQLALASRSIASATEPSELERQAEEDAGHIIANAVRSLRNLETADWKRFFEAVSMVNRILAEDPAATYVDMDFGTRDQYRKAVEQIAAGTSAAEEEAVARRAVDMARSSSGRREHVGYFLLAGGRDELEHAIASRPPWAERWRRLLRRRPTAAYLGSIAVLSGAALAALGSALAGGLSAATTALIAVLAIPSILTVAVTLVNALVTRLLPPHVLPKMDFARGIPARWRTLVAVPSLLLDDGEIDALLDALEIRFLANRDPELHFMLLSDFRDADAAHVDDDEALLRRATAGIAALNARYGAGGRGPFHLLHRERSWNEQEQCWMGWERKRGKLAQLNEWILGGGDAGHGDNAAFAVHVGDPEFRAGVRFVIVLDADTELPRDSARQLAGALAHPLNRAELRGEPARVTDGYTVLQPRVEITPLSAAKSRFAALFSPAAGLDPYTRAVSDVYQDLFGEGTFIGKGIYDVADFERSLHDVVPVNALLSHDLFEGVHGRVGLLSDTVLLEEFPAHYLADARRLERWVRGDWQLLPWLGRTVPSASGPRRNRLPLIARWKIFDNLRRSMVAATMVVLLLAGWLLLPGTALAWTVAVICVPGVPALLDLLAWPGRALSSWVLPPSAAPEPPSLRPALGSWLCEIVFLPHTAAVSTAAIVRTVTRVYVTRRCLLQWTTAAHTARALSSADSAAPCWREMAVAPLLAVAAAALLAALRPQALFVAAPLLLLWLSAPQVAHLLSKPRPPRTPALSPGDARRLRILARRTWSFFEAFVGPADQWLPPDHFQEDPRGVPARRTSPTNIGFLLTSLLGAVDFGYRGVLATALQLKNTFDTLDRMERYHGHFLNWYGTADLVPLEPRYVSTIDSGNLAACLLTVKQACLELLTHAVIPAQLWDGYVDTLAVFREVVERVPEPHRHPLLRVVGEIERCVEKYRDTPSQWRVATAQILTEHAPALDRQLVALLEPEPPNLDAAWLADLRASVLNLKEHVERMQREMDLLLPWLEPRRHVPAELTASADPALAAALSHLDAIAASVPTVTELPDVIERARQAAGALRAALPTLASGVTPGVRVAPGGAQSTDGAAAWITQLEAGLANAAQSAEYLRARLEEGATRAEAFARGMDFAFLYDGQRHLFFIGYNVSAARLDEHHYDLLASEARLTSFLTIARNVVPDDHWVHLGRPIGRVARTRALLSWSGTMFEYLMPALLLREGEATLIGHSCEAAVHEQIAYGRRRGVPWGISECGYYQFDAHLSYQYRAFGVPALGFKRGLDEDLVIAPYASLLALRWAPAEVVENLRRLDALGAAGRYGMYEAIDFTVARQSQGEPPPVVRSFMAHHQGMILAALDNFLHDDGLVRRFNSEPVSKTAQLLVYERPPRRAPVEQPQLERARPSRQTRRPTTAPWMPPLDAPFPQAHLLSNGRYHLVITEAGGGGSRWRDVTLTRWTPDTTLDEDGFRIYLQDQVDGRFWTPFREPGAEPGSRRALFAPHMVEQHGRYGALTARERVLVATDADVEIRHLTLSGEGRRRRIAVIGYGEVVLGDAAGDRRHPAFSKLFVESEYVSELHALVFRRRPRSPTDRSLYLVHTMVLPRGGARPLGYDTSRLAFIGRGGTLRAPAALGERPCRLTSAEGATLDPVMVLAATIDLPPHRPRELAFITAAAESRGAALALAARYRALGDLDWTFELASRKAEEQLNTRGIEPRDLPALTTLLSLLLYPHAALRAAPDVLARNSGGHSMLWRHALSGDLPILLVRIGHAPHAPLLSVLLRAHGYWRDRGVPIDLIILNEHASSYDAHIDDQVLRAIADAGAQSHIHRPGGGIFLLQADQMGEPERTALLSAARVVLDGTAESLAHQLAQVFEAPAALPPLVVSAIDSDDGARLPRPTDLRADNGIGGFTADGSEYLIHLEGAQRTPAPWTNVVANPHCGFVVSERGSACTWAASSGENRLTPWNNDPVSDESGETVYLRDEESGAVWSPTPGPAWGGASYQIRHGVGYSVFRHRCRDLEQELRVFVPTDDALKITALQIINRSDRPRRLTVTYYAEWVLGTTRHAHAPFIIPAFDHESETLTASNPWSEDFAGAVAFAAAGQRLHGFTADRSEFLGRHGDRARPAALTRVGLASSVRAGADPCAALQVHVDLPVGATRTVHFLLGQGDSHAAALKLVRHYRDPAAVQAAWDAMRARWEALLKTRTVQSPDPLLDLMLNRWLPYQTLSSRYWGRSGFYQSGGAFGFRDQLQDVAALLPLAPDLCRAHVLDCAAHQFEEGDVLHWWHPPAGPGVRTRCSDDLLWLPFITAHYVEATGDTGILSARAPYLSAPPLAATEVERYGRYAPGPQTGTLYEHCLRVFDRAGAVGRHGLPLIGSGDWNDGMNLVGVRGRGESVWLGWFLCAALTRFAPLCELMGDRERADEMRARVATLSAALERGGWDGRWYRRGYYDDGSPLGSARQDECRIDSLAQSWAVLSQAGDPRRARLAMEALREHLLRPREGLVLLLTPPFDRSAQEPGYIKGYPPGIRENGGQYSHAAVWAVWAFAALGQLDRAAQLFADLLPSHRADSAEAMQRYRVEPYAMAGDIYAEAHAGRGGWTWYTGAAGWAYRFGWEMLLGLRSEQRGWRVDPPLPSHWSGCTVTLRDGPTVYEIEIVQPAGAQQGVATVHMDGALLADGLMPRLHDGKTHRVQVTLQAPTARAV
jgi:cyclic beta-1,2-glucan synthetase